MIKNSLKTTTIFDNTATVHIICPKIAKILGIDRTLLINQVHYWLNKCGKNIAGEEGLWIYNSLEEWHKQFSYWSMSKLRRVIKYLEDAKLLISRKVNAKKWNHTKWYSLNMTALSKLLSSVKNAPQSYKTKKTNRFVQNEQMLLEQKNNYTNKSSYIEKNSISQNKNITEENLKKKSSRKDSFQKSSIEIPCYQEISITESMQEKAKEMVTIWNEEFKYSLKPIKAFSNKKIAIILCDLYKNQFSNNMDAWRDYVLKVNSSKFLMGEKETKTCFKAVFQWLIKPEVVEAICGGAYGVGDRDLDKNNLLQNIEKQKEEIIKKTNGKIAEYIRNHVSENEEKAEFNAYVLNKKFEKDGDIYRIADQVTNNTWLSPRGLIYDAKNKDVYQMMYESYVMKKYLGKTRLEARAEIKRNIDDLAQKSIGIVLFDKLNFIKNKVETLILSTCGSDFLSMIEAK